MLALILYVVFVLFILFHSLKVRSTGICLVLSVLAFVPPFTFLLVFYFLLFGRNLRRRPL